MKGKMLVVLCIIGMLVGVGVAWAAVLSAQYRMPQTALAPVGAAATFTINGQPWTNNTAIDWGQLNFGDNTKSIVVTNAGSVGIASVTLTSVGLPSTWTETITMGAPAGGGIPGTITLHADASVQGSQSWVSTITISSPP
jgi:hypothetical protein